MSAARPPEGAKAPFGGSDPRAAGDRGGTMSAARPPEGAKAPLGGSDPREAGERGGTMSAARPPEGAKAPLGLRAAAPDSPVRVGTARRGADSGGSAACKASATRAAVERGGYFSNGPGLGLLPLVTRFEPHKTVRHAHARFGDVAGPWSALAGVAVSGYEIHSGQTAQHPAMAAKGDVAREVIPGIAWQNPAGNVLGVYLHGLLEDPAATKALFGVHASTLEAVLDGLADGVARHFEPGVLNALVAPADAA